MAPVIASVTHHRPAVISAAMKNVELVAATWSLLGFPQIASRWVDGEPTSVAMSGCIDRRLMTRPTDERIIRRNAAIVAQANHLAGIVVRILSAGDLGSVARA